jgi:hypothetical protein
MKASGGPLAKTTRTPVRFRLLVGWYRLRVALGSPSWWWQTVLVVGFWVLLGLPVYQASIKRGILHTVFAVVLTVGRAWRYASPKNMQLVRRGYLERKSLLYRLLKEMQYRERMTAADVERFRVDVLNLIASYVRSHRADTEGTEIFVNLIVEDGDHVVVVARDKDHRKPGARYAKDDMIVWRAMRNGEAAFSGDLQAEFPETTDKPYRSVLALPIHGDGTVVGVISIDSTRRHHFDVEHSDLERALAPYVCLAGWTLVGERLILNAKAGGDNP